MLLEVTHETDLVYDGTINESVMELRVCPAQAEDQHRLSFDLAIGPPTQVSGYFDWLDNLVHAFTVVGYHDRLKIVATSVVETDREAVNLYTVNDPWPLTNLDADYVLYDFLQFGGPVVDAPSLRALRDELNPQPGEFVGIILRRAMELIKSRFGYNKGVTTSASPITDILEKGEGVCQDFTHLMIGLCRSMELPARYVSGLVHSEKIEEQQEFLGASETHAWVEVWVPSLGWIGLDPTNNVGVGGSFIKVAVGRHFGDVPPNKGVYRGAAKEKIDVRVTSRRLSHVPPELAAEQMRRLDLPVFDSPPMSDQADAAQQQQQQ